MEHTHGDGMILKGSFKRTEECGMDPFDSGHRPVAGYCKHSFIRGAEFLEKMSIY